MQEDITANEIEFDRVWSSFTDLLHESQDYICSEWHHGVETLRLMERPIEIEKIRDVISTQGGAIKLTYPVGLDAWFAILAQGKFPVYANVRPPEHVAQSDMTDFYHDLFGHAPYFVFPKFNQVSKQFAVLWAAVTKEQRELLLKLWFYTLEFGVVARGDQLYAFGGGLITSNVALKRFINKDIEIMGYDLASVLESGISAAGEPERLFVFESVADVYAKLAEGMRHVV